MILEGIPYQRFVVRFRLADGRRRRWIRHSPGWRWVYEEVARELLYTFGVEGLAHHSVSIDEG